MHLGKTAAVVLLVLLYLLFVSLLKELHVAASLTVCPSKRGAPVLEQIRRGRHTPTLRIHPGINVVGNIAARNPPD